MCSNYRHFIFSYSLQWVPFCLLKWSQKPEINIYFYFYQSLISSMTTLHKIRFQIQKALTVMDIEKSKSLPYSISKLSKAISISSTASFYFFFDIHDGMMLFVCEIEFYWGLLHSISNMGDFLIIVLDIEFGQDCLPRYRNWDPTKLKILSKPI